MSEKAKARKLEDHNSKPVRSLSGGLPAMGPGMVPHHNYAIPPDNYHSGGRLAYRPALIGQSIPMGSVGPALGRVPLTNDMGPPIFMPSLNLGTPKLAANSGNMPHPPSSHHNSKLKQPPNMSSAAAFMTDMLTYPQAPPLSAFHSASLKQVPYIGPPHSCANPKPSPSAPSTSVAKPTPMAHPMAPVTKVVAMDRDTSQPAFSTGGGVGKGGTKSSQGVTKLLTTTSEGGNVKGEGLVTMLSQAYYPQNVLNSPQVTYSLSKMLLAPSSPQPHPEQTTSTSGTAGSKPAAGGVYSGAFSVRGPAGMVSLPTLATSGQPSSNVTFADTTKLDRPPQPSAPHPPIPGVPAAPKELTQQCKEKLSTADVASNMIISNPGLTGKHIAAMTNSSQPPPSSVLPNSAYSSPISSAELLPGSTLLNVPLSQHMDTGWGFPPQPPNFQNALQPPVPMATTGGVSQDASSQQPNVEGLKSRLESGVPPGPPQSPQGSRSGGGQPPSGGEPGQLNSSPRPRILRGKRPLDGNWKLEGQPNSLHSPGSPHRTKLQASSLKKAMMSGFGEQPPSPEAPRPHNHVGVGSRVEDVSASPRKKPRKQNVVANDDQYASNVPDTLQQLIQQQHQSEDGDVEKLCEGVGNSPPEASKPVQVRYLSQLRQSPYPINGVYKLRHLVAHNHFRRYADIKHKSPLPISVYDVANDRSSQSRASGWKLYHFNSQLVEVDKVETDSLVLMKQVQDTLGEVMEDSSCMLDREALITTRELVQGNIDRCNRVKYHMESTTANMFMVLDQRSHVVDVLDKYSNFKSRYSSISPSLSSSSSSHHHKSQS